MIKKLEQLIRRCFTYPLHGKDLYSSPKARIYCDGGDPIFFWFPKVSNNYFDPYWEMFGFVITVFGRQIFFSFGEDKKGFYR